MYSGNMFGRPFILPPGAPTERLEALRGAFTAAMADEALREEAARMQLDVDSVPGAELQTVLAKLYATPPGVVARLRQALVFKP
jgi:tripartite-type tricarboxylate transporter receptor subunit TctC